MNTAKDILKYSRKIMREFYELKNQSSRAAGRARKQDSAIERFEKIKKNQLNCQNIYDKHVVESTQTCIFTR